MKAIIFDFDGVIHNTFELACEIHKQIDSDFSKEKFRSYFEGNIFKIIDKKQNLKAQELFRKMEFEAFKNLKIEGDIKSELEELRKHHELYIISSNTSNNIKLYFENNEVSKLFREILAAEAHKSKVEKFKMLFKKYAFNSDSCIFITDTLGDILEANKVGVKSIACTFGYHEEERLKKGNPFKIVSHFSEIRQVIKNL